MPRPTTFDNIEILRAEIPVGAIGVLDCLAVWRIWKEFVGERQIPVGSADIASVSRRCYRGGGFALKVLDESKVALDGSAVSE